MSFKSPEPLEADSRRLLLSHIFSIVCLIYLNCVSIIFESSLKIEFWMKFCPHLSLFWLHFRSLGRPLAPFCSPLGALCINFRPFLHLWRSFSHFFAPIGALIAILHGFFTFSIDFQTSRVNSYKNATKSYSKNYQREQKHPLETFPSKGPERNMPQALRLTFELPG